MTSFYSVFCDQTFICRSRVVDGFWPSAFGLMFKKRIQDDEGLLIEFPGWIADRSVHTNFMRFDIDCVFLDHDYRVVDIVTLAPWKKYTPSKSCSYVLELNAGVCDKIGLEVGDLLKCL